MFETRGDLVKDSEILFILGAGITSVAEIRDGIAEATFRIS
jgi:hypothetical protein